MRGIVGVSETTSTYVSGDNDSVRWIPYVVA